MKAYIGIDNGVTGSIAFIGDDSSRMFQTPTHKEQSYTKKKAQITRIDWMSLEIALANLVDTWGNAKYVRVFIERPFTGKGYKAVVSGMRALEATLIAVERYGLSYQYIDSKQWQREMLPKGCKGTAELKAASKDVGIRLFPQHKEIIVKQKDADSLLIAEWARRNDL